MKQVEVQMKQAQPVVVLDDATDRLQSETVLVVSRTVDVVQ